MWNTEQMQMLERIAEIIESRLGSIEAQGVRDRMRPPGPGMVSAAIRTALREQEVLEKSTGKPRKEGDMQGLSSKGPS